MSMAWHVYLMLYVSLFGCSSVVFFEHWFGGQLCELAVQAPVARMIYGFLACFQAL